MSEHSAVSDVVVTSLQSIPADWLPECYPALLKAAGQLRSAQDMAVINTLLGNGASYGADAPPTPLSFPRDYAVHLDCGKEWYWLSANLTVDGTDGEDSIHVLAVMPRNRAVTKAVQAQAGWSDAEAQVVDSAATVTVSAAGVSKIVRRTPNIQWQMMGGQTAFETNPFFYQCGPDSFAGPDDGSQGILPLTVVIADGDNLDIRLTMSSDFSGENALFLQGDQGATPPPKLGIYFSWPGLHVCGTIVVEGVTYPVSGTGWIDHQMIMYAPVVSPPPPTLPPPQPSPGWAPLEAFNGWSWCQFNLSNGDAFTAAAFQIGPLKADAIVDYGFYVRRTATGYETTYLVGALVLDRFIPCLEGVMFPTTWRYDVTDLTGGLAFDLTVVPGPIYPDGSFYTGNLEVEGETPVAVTLLNRGPMNRQGGPCQALTGYGYCESVSYQPESQYVRRGLAFLGVSDD